jgi:hypothetical protein
MLLSCLSFIAWCGNVECGITRDSVQSRQCVSTRYPFDCMCLGERGHPCVGLHGACLLALTLDALNLPLWGTQNKRGH